MSLLPFARVDLSDRVDDILERVQPKSRFCIPSEYYRKLTWREIVAHLDKLHAKHVLPGFKDRSAEERDINRATTDITKVHNLLC